MRIWPEIQKRPAWNGPLGIEGRAVLFRIDHHFNGCVDARKRAAVPGLLFHDLRRSAVRNMKRAGLQDLEAMRISGHKTRHVFDRYNIIDEEDLGRRRQAPGGVRAEAKAGTSRAAPARKIIRSATLP
jgi:hypothetical protein